MPRWPDTGKRTGRQQITLRGGDPGAHAPWAVHARRPTLADITTVAQSSWLCSQGLIPLGRTPAGWPGLAVLDKAGQRRARQGKTTDGFRCRFPPKRELPEPGVTQALPHSGYSSLTALRWPCTPADHTALPVSSPTRRVVFTSASARTCWPAPTRRSKKQSTLPSGFRRRVLSVSALARGS